MNMKEFFFNVVQLLVYVLYIRVGHYQLDNTHLPIFGEKDLKTNFGIELWR